MKRGDLLTMSLHGSNGKPRPGIVVLADGLIRLDRPVLVCPLTSDLIPDLLTRPLIEPSPANGLRLPSQVMVDRMTGALHREIGGVFGSLSAEEMQRIDYALMIVLGLMRQLAAPEG